MTEQWETRRSRFNHGWLKNQLIVALRKAIQVRAGLVVNDHAQADLLGTLGQWSTQREAAERILDAVQSCLRELTPVPEETTDERVKRFVNEVERKRWLQDEQPFARWEAARIALSSLDEAVRPVLHVEGGRALELDLPQMRRLLALADKLGETFSGLTLCWSLESVDGVQAS